MIETKRSITTHTIKGLNEHIDIDVLDDAEPLCGASHHYRVNVNGVTAAIISFQEGPVKEAGINGITQEVLLAIVIDRLEGFQQGRFPSDANARAIDSAKKALQALQYRTADRLSRSVEGMNIA